MHTGIASLKTASLICVAGVCFFCVSSPRHAGSSVRQSSLKSRTHSAKKKNTSSTQTGFASYYGKKFHGKKTANGERFDMNAYTAAHRTLPFNTRVKVINVSNNTSVVVRINDRGPFIKKCIIDLSKAAAKKIGILETGTAKVRLEIQ